MEFNVGELIFINNEVYDIKGKILYVNKSDNCYWHEYKIISRKTNLEKWLSVDETYNEYSISMMVRNNISISNYHLVDEGTLEVVNSWGNVDVDCGETAKFYEYEDSSEENIISIEEWSDGRETSKGYYLDSYEIQRVNGYSNKSSLNRYNKTFNPIIRFISVFAILGVIMFFVSLIFSPKTIAKHLKNDSSFSYVTSITGSKNQKADVYKSLLSLDLTAKNIISGIDGKTESVQQNTEDGDTSIAILTKKEYCLVYTSEDQEVLVQISKRKYTYLSDNTPYRASSYTNRYYRRYYYTKAFETDKKDYGGTSSYSSFDDTTVGYDGNDTYNSYSSSIRQYSVKSRSSSGGGVSSGK